MEHQKSSPHRHNLKHEHIRGDDLDRASHSIDAFYSPRIIDELVIREVNGRRVYGEVFAVVTPDAASAEQSPHHPSEQLDSLCLVRYPDTQEVGIASRALVGEDVVMYPGAILSPDTPVIFGREGDREGMTSEQEVLGRVALTGVAGASFGDGVSRIHGSIYLDSRGHVTISDGREDVDLVTRHVIDRASTNHTRVSIAESHLPPRHDLITEQKQMDARESAKQRFANIFGAPQFQERGRFGNVSDRLTFMNAETIMDARKLVARVDDEQLKQIIESHLEKGTELGSEAAVTAIRTNDELRFAAANYLLEKAEKIAHLLPDRVMSKNHKKRGDHPGYPEGMRSREYAAVLAISMLDGTFVTSRSRKDTVQFISDNHGTRINGGQHRLAALTLLDVNGNATGHIVEERKYY